MNWLKRALLLSLTLLIASAGTLKVLAETDSLNDVEELVIEQTYVPIKRSYVRHNKHIYVRIEKSEFEALEKQVILTDTILQRLITLEKLYNQIKQVVDAIGITITFIKKMFNIADSDIFKPMKPINEFEHSSGVKMSPGYVEISAELSNNLQTFRNVLPENILDLDLYYDKNLFTLDHIEGQGVLGDKFVKIALPQNLAGSRDRLQIPISNALKNVASFKVFLAPLDPENIPLGSASKISARYNKTVPRGTIAPLSYKLASGSPSTIKVVSK